MVDSQNGQLTEINPDCGTVQSLALHSSATLSSHHNRNDVDPWSVSTGADAVWITDGTRVLRRADPATRARHQLPAARPRQLGGRRNERIVGDQRPIGEHLANRSAQRPGDRPGAVRWTSRTRVAVSDRSRRRTGRDLGAQRNTADVTRVDPTQARVTATIPIGIARGPRRLAVGAGAVWVADAGGTLARIDTSTNSVTVQSIAPSLYDVGVGAGGVWVTSGTGIGGAGMPAGTVPGPQVQALPQSRCSPIASQPGAHPRYLIVSDFPLQGEHRDTGAQMSEAIEFELRARGFRAGPYAVGFQACDDAVASQLVYIANRCASNVRTYAADKDVIGMIGPLNSFCARDQIRIANRAPGGPLGIVSPSTTRVGLTRHGPGSEPGEPGVYYPSGQRSFVRIVAADDVQAAANVILARQLHLRRVFVATVAGTRTPAASRKASWP
jgi:hypothetical protein